MRSWAVAGVGAALLVVAVLVGAAVLVVPAIALLGLAHVAELSVAIRARTTALSRTVERATVQEQEHLDVGLTLTAGPAGLGAGELVLDGRDEPVTMPRGRRWHARMVIAIPARGVHPLPPVRLRLRDPLGIARRDVLPAPQEVLVLPRVEAVTVSAPGGLGLAEGSARRGRTSTGTDELDGLRPIASGAPSATIHWPTYARTGELYGRTRVASLDRHPLVVVDPEHAQDGAALDEAVRAAASLSVHLARRGGCRVLLPGLRGPQPLGPRLAGWPALHTRLAVLAPGDAPSLALRGLSFQTVLWVSARHAGLPRGLIRASAADRCLVAPVPLLDEPVAFTVAGCSGQWLSRR